MLHGKTGMKREALLFSMAVPIQNASTNDSKENRGKQAIMSFQTVFLDVERVKAIPVLVFKG